VSFNFCLLLFRIDFWNFVFLTSALLFYVETDDPESNSDVEYPKFDLKYFFILAWATETATGK